MFDEQQVAEDEIQMAPLIDIVFLLLIFFLVVSTLKKPVEELPVDLPVSAAALQTAEGDEPFVVGVDREGRIYLEGDPVSLERFHERVREVAAAAPDQQIRIDGDRHVDLQHVIHVMDVLQFEGLHRIGIQTRSPENGG